MCNYQSLEVSVATLGSSDAVRIKVVTRVSCYLRTLCLSLTSSSYDISSTRYTALFPTAPLDRETVDSGQCAVDMQVCR